MPENKTDGTPSEHDSGDRVGPYRLLRMLGFGGMGEVWLAEPADSGPQRDIALKLPVLGVRRNVLVQRFERERDILGALSHPHIARLYDAGIAVDGQPYLALEYVEGLPITEFAETRWLNARERVELVLQVMDAVQYAHANLVVHRDIKPCNVLVTPEAKSMLLDFGIAKMLEDEHAPGNETELTRLGGRALTLQYAAPEQIKRSAISTSCDIWALGVLLYELLTTVRPFNSEQGDLAHEVLFADPIPMAQLRSGAIAGMSRGLAEELDTIVRKALKKNPAERYATVSAFAEDLSRWLQGEPVLAQRDSAWYRIRKFAQRHTLGVTAALAGSALVITVAGFAIVMGIQARVESQRAVAARNFLMDMFRHTDPDRSRGQDITAKQLLALGRKNILDSMSDQPLLQAELMLSLADAFAAMDDFATAQETYSIASRLFLMVGDRLRSAHALLDQVQIVVDEVEDHERASLLLDEVIRAVPEHRADKYLLTRYYIAQMFVSHLQGDMQKKAAWYEKVHPIADDALVDTSPRTVFAMRILSESEGEMGIYTQAIERLEKLKLRLEQDHNARPADILGTVDDLGYVEFIAGRYRASLQHFDAAARQCELALNAMGAQCKYAQYHRAHALLTLGFNTRAKESLAALLPHPDTSDDQHFWPSAYTIQAFNIVARNRQLDLYPALDRELQEMTGTADSNALPANIRMLALSMQARVLLEAQRPADAQKLLLRANAILIRTPSADLRQTGRIPAYLGLAAHAQGDYPQALAAFDRADTLHTQALGALHPLTLLVSLHRARTLWATGQGTQALAIVDRAIPVLRSVMGEDAPTVARILVLRSALTAPPPPDPKDAPSVDIFF